MPKALIIESALGIVKTARRPLLFTSGRQDLNLRPPDPQPGALPSCDTSRSWCCGGKDVTEKREINPNDTENIRIALEDGWVITFPQGTTRSFKPVRKGTAHIILQHKPIVVPIVIDGFRRSFDRKGLMIKKKGILQSMVIKEPLQIDYENDSVDKIVEMIEFAIEQHPSLLKVIPAEELEEKEKLDKERMWKY